MAVTGVEQYTTSYTYDANNRLLEEKKAASDAVTTTAYRYDPNGNQIAKASETLSSPAAAGQTSSLGVAPSRGLYTYDGFNRLVRALENDADVR